MDIYSILASKPHNPHYLKRYIKFVEQCQKKNYKSLAKTHKHHICPKAKDMFPQYSCFSKNKWNMARLTPRQHFIAHIILWKCFPRISSQRSAVWQMKHRNNEQVNSRLYEKMRKEHVLFFSEKLKGKVACHDVEGNFHLIPKKEYNKKNYKPISAGRVVAKNDNGDIIVVDVKEFQSEPNLHGYSKGIKIWNDGAKNVYSFEKPGDSFVIGSIPLTEEEKYRRNKKRKNTYLEKTPEELNSISRNKSIAKKRYYDSLTAEERKKSSETKKKMSEAALKKNPGFSATHKCPKCGKEGQKANISRHHGLEGEKCRW